MTSKEAVIVN